MGDAVHGDLLFLHDLQQGRLAAGGGAVDLVGQDDLGEKRTGPELKLALLLVEEVDAGQVRGHQVRGELDAAEVPADAPGEGAQQHGLAGAGHVLQQDVPRGDQADHDLLDHLVLADDDAAAVVQDLFFERNERLGLHRRSSQKK